MNALEHWVGDTSRFFSTYWRQSPHIFEPPGGASSPFTLGDIDAALGSGFFHEPYLEMWADDSRLPFRNYTSPRTVAGERPGGFVDTSKVRGLLDEGATLLLRNVDQWHAPTRHLLTRLAGELGREIEAFFFVTPAGRAGLPLHRDDADVLVVQVSGSKHWSVHEGPADGNWGAGRVRRSEAQPAEIMKAVLRQGEVLYIPRGFAHRATGQDGLSAHLSLTIREVGSADLAESLRECLAQDLQVAARPVSDATLSDAGAALLETARDRLAALTPEALITHARRRGVERMPGTPGSLSLVELAAAWPARGGAADDGPGDAGAGASTGTERGPGAGRRPAESATA
ncbi:JmjC domain-containing protein [Streptomyces sp. NPDC059474]|uniref:JmjC domain-containing protein n=1 Tax=Streptomyces sp. NPDC059474 TaxID=3346846 RepID=UPI0036BE7A67